MLYATLHHHLQQYNTPCQMISKQTSMLTILTWAAPVKLRQSSTFMVPGPSCQMLASIYDPGCEIVHNFAPLLNKMGLSMLVPQATS